MKHWEYHPVYDETCFGCKAGTLQMNAGDATRDIPDKKWNAELNKPTEMLGTKECNQQEHQYASYSRSI
jgi:hypothetical protein